MSAPHSSKCPGCGNSFAWSHFGEVWFALGLACCSKSCQQLVLTIESQDDEQPDDRADSIEYEEAVQ